jgi:hypothetical protein
LLAIAVYLPSLGGEFLWDDNTSVTESEIVHEPGGWWKAWVAPLESHPDYFPLTTTVFWLEWRLWGDHALGYRVVNLLLHAGTAVLLWRLFRALRLSGTTGFLYPLHSAFPSLRLRLMQMRQPGNPLASLPHEVIQASQRRAVYCPCRRDKRGLHNGRTDRV